MELSLKIENISNLIAKKTKDCLASIHIDFAGLIRLGDTNVKRLENFNQIILKAESKGANAVVGVRFVTSTVAQGASEILIYGTAVELG